MKEDLGVNGGRQSVVVDEHDERCILVVGGGGGGGMDEARFVNPPTSCRGLEVKGGVQDYVIT